MQSATKPRLLIITATNPLGPFGSQFLVRQHLTIFERSGHFVCLATPEYCGEFRSERWKDESSGPSIQKIWNLRRLLSSSIKAIESFRPDLILAHNYEAGLIGKPLKKRYSIPMIYIPHGLLEMELPSYYRSPMKRRVYRVLGRALDTRILMQMDYVAALTQRMKDYLNDNYDLQNVAIIPPPFEKLESNLIIKREKKSNSIFYSGNPYGYQGLDFLIDLMKKVKEKVPEIRLSIAANPPRNKWEQTIYKLRKVVRTEIHFPKTVSETMEIASRSSLGVIPRLDPYGFPMKIHFYVNCGLPIVAFNSGWSGLIDGKTALLSKPGDTDDMAEKMILLLANSELAITLSQNACIEFSRNYDSISIDLKYQELFSKF